MLIRIGMEEVLHNISIKKFRSRFPDAPGSARGDDLLIADLRYARALSVFKYPFRFDGYIIIFCISFISVCRLIPNSEASTTLLRICASADRTITRNKVFRGSFF